MPLFQFNITVNKHYAPVTQHISTRAHHHNEESGQSGGMDVNLTITTARKSLSSMSLWGHFCHYPEFLEYINDAVGGRHSTQSWYAFRMDRSNSNFDYLNRGQCFTCRVPLVNA